MAIQGSQGVNGLQLKGPAFKKNCSFSNENYNRLIFQSSHALDSFTIQFGQFLVILISLIIIFHSFTVLKAFLSSPVFSSFVLDFCA